jgi:hypothetical protein
MFQTNIGQADTVIRLALATMIIVFSLIAGHAAFALIALIPLATAFAGICPLYSVLGIHTNGAAQTH